MKIVSNPFGVSEALEALGRLKETVSGFAAREEQLNKEFRAETYASKRAFDETMVDEQARADATMEVEEDRHLAELARIEAKFSGRAERIQRASKTSREMLRQRVEGSKGRKIFDAQSRTMNANRDRETALSRLEAEHDAFKGRLGEERDTYSRLAAGARKRFLGYGRFRRMLGNEAVGDLSAAVLKGTPEELLISFASEIEAAGTARREFARFPFPRFFGVLPLWLLLALSMMAAVGVAYVTGMTHRSYVLGGAVLVGFGGLSVALHAFGGKQAGPAAREWARRLENARQLYNACREKENARYDLEVARINDLHAKTVAGLEATWSTTVDDASARQKIGLAKLEKQLPRVKERNERMHREFLQRYQPVHPASVARLEADWEMRKKSLEENHAQEVAAREAKFAADFETLVAEWKENIMPVYSEIEAMRARASEYFPEWKSMPADTWKPPTEFAHMARFGEIEVDVGALAGALPKDERLALPGPARFGMPLALSLPNQGSILFETEEGGREEMQAALSNLMLRLLATTPAGKLTFTILDPVGLGEGFAGFMHLADHEESLINRRIWTQRGQIEQRLADLNEHIEKVIQMYLRNEYETITEYNKQAGNIAEKYHFLVIADFPVNFSETAAKRLQSIAASGARCGIYTLIHWDHRQAMPQDFVPDDLRKSSICVKVPKKGGLVLDGGFKEGAVLKLDTPPSAEYAIDFIHRVGKSSKDSNRVEVPFSHVTPAEGEYWKNVTTEELRVAIGRSGATKLQYLAIGKGTRQHALFAGKTGSGKSTLFHIIVTNLALSCSPEQVEFYLVDFKKGVEFKCYAARQLPHARVVAIESDREFALSVLQRVDEELKRRGDLFRKAGVQDIPGYVRSGGGEAMPRTLLMIDEFQEFFVEDDRIAQTASVLLDRIVRQGRAFGIHVLLGSQTLGGAYTLARTTLGQMVIRIALQCNEADAYLIMDDNNPAPRLLTRPGEGIYNDSAGAVEGNSPFQAVWLPEDVRDEALDKVVALAKASGKHYPAPIVFEGNAPSNIRENPLLVDLLRGARPTVAPAAARIWLGAPNSIKGPTEAVFQRQSGSNLLIVGQRDEAALTMIGVGLVALAAQYPVGAARFYLLDGAAPGSSERAFFDKIIAAIPHPITEAHSHDLGSIMGELAETQKARAAGEDTDGPPAFLFIHGLQKYKKLRHEDDFSFSIDEDEDAKGDPGAQFNDLMNEGSAFGLHIIASVDTFNNVNRFISRKALSEFEMRVLFQMSTNDSAALIDSPNASNLGLHRALFYNEHEGYLETFRPYALPGDVWITEVASNLGR